VESYECYARLPCEVRPARTPTLYFGTKGRPEYGHRLSGQTIRRHAAYHHDDFPGLVPHQNGWCRSPAQRTRGCRGDLPRGHPPGRITKRHLHRGGRPAALVARSAKKKHPPRNPAGRAARLLNQAAVWTWCCGESMVSALSPAGMVTRIGIMTQNRPVWWRQIPGLSSSLRQRVLPISKPSAR
jgi:hypothetical protein